LNRKALWASAGALALALVLALPGCMVATLACPDKTSTVSYKGLTLTGATTISCIANPSGGDTISVSGMDILALAAAVAPLVAARQPAVERPSQ
jgi:hypothetical protein